MFDSDIEILSNPSQSSIEVLDSFSIQSSYSRKQSEERKISQVPSLDTIEDDPMVAAILINNNNGDNTNLEVIPKKQTTIITQTEQQQQQTTTPLKSYQPPSSHLGIFNLTESSSSGSVTDSICTAYEQTHGNLYFCFCFNQSSN